MTPPLTFGNESNHASWVRDRIRHAEQSISAGEYLKALEHLQEIRNAEPANKYIPAIIERVELLLKESRQTVTALRQFVDAGKLGSEAGRSITMSTRHEFYGEDSSNDNARVSLSQMDIEARVRQLTIVASSLFDRGSYEAALDALRKAYHLDPENRSVVECESILRPAFEQLRKRATSMGVVVPLRAMANPDASPTVSEYLEKTQLARGRVVPTTALQRLDNKKPDAQQPPDRIELLKRQRDLQRREREQEMWREASKAPGRQRRNAGKPVERRECESDDPSGGPEGFFAKLKQGKLLS
jgi:tetratricopeptide (TPR) repeat protein